MGSEAGVALLGPAVLRRVEVIVEGADRVVVTADGGLRPAQHTDQVGGPLVEVSGGPVPGVLVAEFQELPHDRLPALDRLLGQPAPAQLLLGPALQHRVHDRVFLAQQHHAADQLQPSRSLGLVDLCRHNTSSPHDE